MEMTTLDHPADTKSSLILEPPRSSLSDISDTSGEEQIDDRLLSSTFSARKTFWIPPSTLFTTHLEIPDLTLPLAQLDTLSIEDKNTMSDSYREAVSRIAGGKPAPPPKYVIDRQSVLKPRFTFCAVTDTSSKKAQGGEPLAYWKHGYASIQHVELSFPKGSPHSQHDVEVTVPQKAKANGKTSKKYWSRKRFFVHGSVPYSWEMDSSVTSNKLTLFKGSERKVVARYVRRLGAIFTGGVLAVDDEAVDEVVAVLTCLVVLRQNKQRTAERSSYGGGGGGGGDGGC